MNNFKNLLLVLFLFITQIVFAQKNILSGYVIDASTGEKLIGANVFCNESKQGVVSNNYGFFSLKLPNTPICHLSVSYIGFMAKHITLNENNTQTINIELTTQASEIAEVNIQANNQTVKGLSELSIPISQLKALPALLGEPDVIRALSFTPGINTGLEGTVGLNVRGGSPDQNLILLDEAPIYNASHAGGIVSVFNPNALKSMDVFKANFPARYGGRLSSVLDISMKEGNNKHFEGNFTFGILNSNLTLQGPLAKNKASYLFAARYFNMAFISMLSRLPSSDSYNSAPVYQFYDVNAKVNYQLSSKTQAFISFFKGLDLAGSKSENPQFKRDFYTDWGNTTATARLSHVFSPKVFGKFVLVYSKYQNQIGFDLTKKSDTSTVNTFYKSNTSVTDLTAKLRLDIYTSPQNTILTGLDLIHHQFLPSSIKSNINTSGVSGSNEGNVSAIEIAPYFENQYQLTNRLKTNLGVRWVSYLLPNKSYHSLEPRIGIDYDLGKSWTAKAGFSKMKQFVHLLANQGANLPNDIWLPASQDFKPSNATIFSLGIYKNIPKHGLEFSAEVYSKRMDNLLDYKEGTSFLQSYQSDWANFVEKNGKGKAYGVELYMAKNKGKLTGWVSYTFSRSERQFQNINEGNIFPSKYDRPHNLNIVAAYKLSKKWTFNTAWTLQSGHAATLPIAAYDNKSGISQYIYSGRNQRRLPVFHRLDLSFSKQIKFIKNYKLKERNLTLGLYNAYHRANANAIEVQERGNFLSNKPSEFKVIKHSFLPILPSISYSWKL